MKVSFSNYLQKSTRVGLDVFLLDYLCLLINNKHVHGLGVEIDSTIVLVSLAVKSHTDLLLESFLDIPSYRIPE